MVINVRGVRVPTLLYGTAWKEDATEGLVLDALDQIFANIASEAASIAGGAISTQRLTTSGGLVYQAQFDPADWSGDLIPYPVTMVGGNAVP